MCFQTLDSNLYSHICTEKKFSTTLWVICQWINWFTLVKGTHLAYKSIISLEDFTIFKLMNYALHFWQVAQKWCYGSILSIIYALKGRL